MKRRRVDDGFGETQWEAPTQSQCVSRERWRTSFKFVDKLYKVLAFKDLGAPSTGHSTDHLVLQEGRKEGKGNVMKLRGETGGNC